jgi:hypothetical protein
MPIAFLVWDGFSRERGNRRGLTVWHSIYGRARSGPIGRSAPMVRTALLFSPSSWPDRLWVRRRDASRGGDELGGERRQQPPRGV